MSPAIIWTFVDEFFYKMTDVFSMRAPNQTILCLDDESDNLDAIERLVRKKYHIIKTTSPLEALEILKMHQDIFLILCDQKMPIMSGIDFLKESLNYNQTALRVLITGYADIETVIEAINEGQVYKYISKPWEPQEFILNIDKCYENFGLRHSLAEKNKELEEALKELKNLDQSKNQFMVLINHELKTPLTSMISFIELLRETPLNEEQKKFIERLSSGSEKLKSIIEDVLLFMRAQMKQIQITPTSFFLSEVIEQSLLNYQKEIAQKKIQFEYLFDNQKMMTDRRILTEILNRVFHNAIKFSEPSSQIQIQYDQNGFRISNIGPQISEKIIAKITQPFFLDENIMNHTTGIGMGLSISHALLKILNSHLVVENTSEGVRVLFKL